MKPRFHYGHPLSLFGGMLQPILAQMDASFAPLSQVLRAEEEERPNALILRVEVPGVSKDQIQLEMVEGMLRLRVERRSGQVVETEAARRSEFAYGTAARSFLLPKDACLDDISAELKDGILTISVPRASQGEGRSIPVK